MGEYYDNIVKLAAMRHRIVPNMSNNIEVNKVEIENGIYIEEVGLWGLT